MKKRRPIRKRSFLLFEIVISLLLVSLCFFPLLKPHITIRKVKMEDIQKMEWERLSQNAYCHLKQRLFEHKEHPWDKLPKAKGTLDGDYKIGTKKYSCKYTLEKWDESPKKSIAKGLVLKATFEFFHERSSPFSFSRYFFLEKPI